MGEGRMYVVRVEGEGGVVRDEALFFEQEDAMRYSLAIGVPNEVLPVRSISFGDGVGLTIEYGEQ